MKAESFFKKLSILHYLAVAAGFIIFILNYISLRGTRWFIPFIIVALSIAWFPFWVDFFVNRRKQREIERIFPDFVSDLVNTVKSGVPISRGIVQISSRDYGALSPHVKKLANQIEWAIPLHKALTHFAARTRNSLISRSISTVIEAEKSGGNIEDVLRGITKSLVEIKELKDRRKAMIHSQIVQSYVIFGVFLIVMVFIQNSLIPYLSRIQGGALGAVFGGAATTSISIMTRKVAISFASFSAFFLSLKEYLINLDGIFTLLAIIQGLFAGLVLGKLSEGEVAAGIKHSLILMTAALLVMTIF
jgi:flagellar protein FlaJ